MVKRRNLSGLAFAAVSAFAFITPDLFAQGSLTPPGPPAPIMKTLDQVEPRLPINATNTPGDGTSSFKITASGSYFLIGNVTGESGKNGISVSASNVTIDLNGFAVNGTGGSLDGIHVEPGNSRLTVRNGIITNWGGDGVDEVDADSPDGIYEDIRASGNSGDGLRLDEKSMVRDCKLEHNTGNGLSVNGRATIRNCTASDNGLNGFTFGGGSILDSVALANGNSGIQNFSEPVLIKGCVAADNGINGIRSGSGGKVSDCVARNNSIMGFDVGYYSTVTNCTAKNNGWGFFAGGYCLILGNMGESNGNGIEVFDEKNRIDGNQMMNGSTGIRVDSGNNLILRNAAGNNGSNYEIGINNRYGPIVDLTTTITAAVSGSSAADTSTTTHPWANFAY
jgi:hypothetical protein